MAKPTDYQTRRRLQKSLVLASLSAALLTTVAISEPGKVGLQNPLGRAPRITQVEVIRKNGPNATSVSGTISISSITNVHVWSGATCQDIRVSAFDPVLKRPEQQPPSGSGIAASFHELITFTTAQPVKGSGGALKPGDKCTYELQVPSATSFFMVRVCMPISGCPEIQKGFGQTKTMKLNPGQSATVNFSIVGDLVK